MSRRVATASTRNPSSNTTGRVAKKGGKKAGPTRAAKLTPAKRNESIGKLDALAIATSLRLVPNECLIPIGVTTRRARHPFSIRSNGSEWSPGSLPAWTADSSSMSSGAIPLASRIFGTKISGLSGRRRRPAECLIADFHREAGFQQCIHRAFYKPVPVYAELAAQLQQSVPHKAHSPASSYRTVRATQF